ncbi:MAG: hypothetical protein K2K78_03455 [Muribaculaceae bacterium]|nr:hypothetical protein [Muribaculaceae bacterium]
MRSVFMSLWELDVVAVGCDEVACLLAGIGVVVGHFYAVVGCELKSVDAVEADDARVEDTECVVLDTDVFVIAAVCLVGNAAADGNECVAPR